MEAQLFEHVGVFSTKQIVLEAWKCTLNVGDEFLEPSQSRA